MTFPRLLITLVCLALAGTAAPADVINVPEDYPTIQGAINASTDGDVIQIAAGNYYEYSLNPAGKSLTIQGTLDSDGSLLTTIDAQQIGSVFYLYEGFDALTVIKDLVITGGYGSEHLNSTSAGGGIYCRDSDLTITGCEIKSNNAGISSDGGMTPGFGGGLYCYSSGLPRNITLVDCKITENYGCGGGLMCRNEINLTLSGCSFTQNYSPPLEEGDNGSFGGGIYCFRTLALRISDCEFSNNYTSYNGGGIEIYLGQSAIITNCVLDSNQAGNAGGGFVAYASHLLIRDCLISNNNSSFAGGIAFGFDTKGILLDSTVVSNTSKYRGAVFMEGSECNIDNSTIADNQNTDGWPGGGIGVRWSETTIKGCTIANNTVAADTEYSQGGGLFIDESELKIIDSTISGNSADEGGGIYCRWGGYNSPIIYDCYIIDNQAAAGGGIYSYGADTWIKRTFVCSNISDQIVGNWNDEGENTIADECSTCPGDATGDFFVDVNDVLYVLSAWGSDDVNADFNDNGLVDVNDVLILLSQFGEPCP
ncbi:MAG: hypothetical protein CMJ39_10510 [Phycisphaerae bacterium]|nr:hypothetical protein [Phycisphaerae bacterium]